MRKNNKTPSEKNLAISKAAISARWGAGHHPHDRKQTLRPSKASRTEASRGCSGRAYNYQTKCKNGS